MTDRKLDQLLESLPRAKADDNFTRDVMQRINSQDTRTSKVRLPWARVAVAASILAASLLVVGLWRTPDGSISEEDRAQLAELQLEYAQLGRELESLRGSATEPPVIYLGGNESVSFVLDLNQLAHQAEEVQAMPAGNGGKPLIN